jgi:hypothetical protein
MAEQKYYHELASILEAPLARYTGVPFLSLPASTGRQPH